MFFYFSTSRLAGAGSADISALSSGSSPVSVRVTVLGGEPVTRDVSSSSDGTVLDVSLLNAPLWTPDNPLLLTAQNCCGRQTSRLGSAAIRISTGFHKRPHAAF
jgi:hypothetical protein